MDAHGTRRPVERYALAEGVIFLPVQDGSARLLDLDRSFYAVSAVGARMLREVCADGPAAATARIANQYGVSRQRVSADLATFLETLKARRLIRDSSASPQARTPGITLASLLVTPAVRVINRVLRSWSGRARMLLPLALLSLRVFGWTRTVDAWMQSRLSGAAAAEDGTGHGQFVPGDPETIVRAIDAAVSAATAKHLSLMTCRERALCCWALAMAAGLPATIVVGISLFPMAAHCWCESGPWTLGDDTDFCRQYVPVARYGEPAGIIRP